MRRELSILTASGRKVRMGRKGLEGSLSALANTIKIVSWIITCSGVCHMHCRIFSINLGHYLWDISSTPPFQLSWSKTSLGLLSRVTSLKWQQWKPESLSPCKDQQSNSNRRTKRVWGSSIVHLGNFSNTVKEKKKTTENNPQEEKEFYFACIIPSLLSALLSARRELTS